MTARLDPEAPPTPAAKARTPDAWRKAWRAGQALMAAGKWHEARPALTRALLAAPEGQARERIKQALANINAELLFSPRMAPDSKVHVVRPGESLWILSQKYNITIGLLKRINRKRSDVLRSGDRMKVIVGAWSALVQKSKFRIIVFLNGQFVREYPIGIGAHGRTPAGVFVIRTKAENPTWYGPDNVYPAGHPGNILGTRWLGFRETTEYQGYGIHGTTAPDEEFLGRAVSNGCIRMRNTDVEELYDLLRRGDKVTIAP